jgi:hypothetical protein
MADTQLHSGLDGPFAGRRVLRSLAQNWWLLLLRGVAAIAFISCAPSARGLPPYWKNRSASPEKYQLPISLVPSHAAPPSD